MKLSDGDIVEMIFFPIVNEACRILAEGVAVKASDLDIASVLGMEFPAYRFLFLIVSNSIMDEDWTLTFCNWVQGRNHFLGQFYWVHIHLLKIEGLVNDTWRFLQAVCLFSGTSCQGSFSGETSKLLLLCFTCRTVMFVDSNGGNISYRLYTYIRVFLSYDKWLMFLLGGITRG